MAIGRYDRTARISGGTQFGTSVSANTIHRAARRGNLSIEHRVLREGQRLDQIAGQFYGDGRLWWIIAAASGIGWSPQCPAGTVLFIPTDLVQIENLVG